jgi:hypothetical protein
MSLDSAHIPAMHGWYRCPIPSLSGPSGRMLVVICESQAILCTLEGSSWAALLPAFCWDMQRAGHLISLGLLQPQLPTGGLSYFFPSSSHGGTGPCPSSSGLGVLLAPIQANLWGLHHCWTVFFKSTCSILNPPPTSGTSGSLEPCLVVTMGDVCCWHLVVESRMPLGISKCRLEEPYSPSHAFLLVS